MPRKNEYTVIVERPVSRARAMSQVKMLTEMVVRQADYTTSAIPRELRPGEDYRLAYPPEGFLEALADGRPA